MNLDQNQKFHKTNQVLNKYKLYLTNEATQMTHKKNYKVQN